MSEQPKVAWEVTDSATPNKCNAWCFVMAVDRDAAIAEAQRIDPAGDSFDLIAIDPEVVTVIRRPAYDGGIRESALFADSRMWAPCAQCEREVRCDTAADWCMEALDEDADDDAEDACYPVIGEHGAIYCCESCWQEAGETKCNGDSPVLADGICLFADV